jgi:hypothetical protein
MREKIQKILEEAANAEINMQSFVARELLTNKIMLEFNRVLINEEVGENNG